MEHKKIQKRFLLYIDGDLPEVEEVLIEQHLNECSSCKNISMRSQIFGMKKEN